MHDTKTLTPVPCSLEDTLEQLSPAVFYGWKLGSKGDNESGKKKHLTLIHMTPNYLQDLAQGNVGVAFGERSIDEDGNVLVGIDMDRHDFVAAFVSANPWVYSTWVSRGRPDRMLVVVRIRGCYPKTRDLVDAAGGNIGEWKADDLNGKCVQSIVPPSLHPTTNQDYQCLNLRRPAIIDFNDIRWPSIVANPPALNPLPDQKTIHPPIPPTPPNATVLTTMSVKTVRENRSENPSVKTVAQGGIVIDYLRFVTPNRVNKRGHSNQQLKNLAMRTKNAINNGIPLDPHLVFEHWWTLSSGNVDPSAPKQWFEQKWGLLYNGSNGGSIDDFVKDASHRLARGERAPGTEKLDDNLQFLAMVCWLMCKNGLFAMSCRMVLTVLAGHPRCPADPMGGLRLLKTLIYCGIILEIKKGQVGAPSEETHKQATIWKYIGGSGI